MPSHSVVSIPATSSTSRKRNSTFSEPLPRKTSRTMLRRTESFLSLSDCNDENQYSEGTSFLNMTSSPSRVTPLNRIALHYKEQRAKPGRRRAEFTIGPVQPRAPLPKRAAHVPLTPPLQLIPPHLRASSPLAPMRKLLPPRASFPRSRPEPDLYRLALKGQMRSSPEGEKILRMGPRLAIAIISATRELERIVSSCEDDDVTMGDDTAQSAGWGIGHDSMMVAPCGA